MEVGVGEVHAWGCAIWRKGVLHRLYWQVQRLLERIALGNLGVLALFSEFLQAFFIGSQGETLPGWRGYKSLATVLALVTLWLHLSGGAS